CIRGRNVTGVQTCALPIWFGQNFIVNPGVPPKIVDAAGIDRRFGVLEIGPGIGVLTREIARRAGKVVAIEVDKRLPPVLAETLEVGRASCRSGAERRGAQA